jgi:chromate transporter
MIDSLSWEIFRVFLKLSFISFGGLFGALPELEREIVVNHHWLSHDVFIRSFVMAQFVPGPNTIMCPLLGFLIHGWPGFLAGFLGVYLPPLAIMGAAFAFFHRYRRSLLLRRLAFALRPMVIGLVSASALQLWWIQTTSLFEGIAFSLAVSLVILSVGGWLYHRKKVSAIPFLLLCGFIPLVASFLRL